MAHATAQWLRQQVAGGRARPDGSGGVFVGGLRLVAVAGAGAGRGAASSAQPLLWWLGELEDSLGTDAELLLPPAPIY